MISYKSPETIAMLIWPSLRALAYLEVLNEYDFLPDEVIILKNDEGNQINRDLANESRKYNYHQFYNISNNINDFFVNKNCKVINLNTKDVNDPMVIRSVKRLKNKYIIFSGGGILKKIILSLNKFFIHIHPGIIPTYRGSTCFNYSLLENYSLGSTAYFMNKNIDSGEIILQRDFKINYFIHPDQPLFIDYILDNYIRSQTLKATLALFRDNIDFKTRIEDCSGFAYYIMHPLLRYLTIEKINKEFSHKIKSEIKMI